MGREHNAAQRKLLRDFIKTLKDRNRIKGYILVQEFTQETLATIQSSLHSV
jgi:hypothetical protein